MYLKGMKNCQLCDLSKTRKHVLKGEGNSSADIMLIAQAPGEVEDAEGKMFIGPSGKVLDDLFEAAGIRRNTVYITNLLKCMLPQNRRPKQKEISSCSLYLEEEIRRLNPRIISPLGYYATKYIFETNRLGTFTKSDYPQKIGRVFYTARFFVFPLTHPSSIIHHAEYFATSVINYRSLIDLKECKWFRVCPLKHFTDRGLLDNKWVENYCLGDWESCVRFQLEAAGTPHPDQLLPDGSMLVPSGSERNV